VWSWGERDEAWINAKIKSAMDRATTQERNLQAEIDDFIASQERDFSVTTMDKELEIVTKRHKATRRMCLSRRKDVTIEKVGSREGWWRPINQNPDEETEFLETIPEEFPIKLPLGLNEKCKVYPQNIIIIAGSKSAGKTSVLLNIAKDNQDDHEVIYFNSEMGDEEWTERLRAFGITKKCDQRFRAPKRTRNFHEKIDGKRKVYIIDFLEIHSEFYNIGDMIAKIHEKLGEGICFIAVQKNPTKETAHGGYFSAEKARLYLSMDYVPELRATKITIFDAKFPKVMGGIRGMYRHVKIIGGAKLEYLKNKFGSDEDWGRKEDKL